MTRKINSYARNYSRSWPMTSEFCTDRVEGRDAIRQGEAPAFRDAMGRAKWPSPHRKFNLHFPSIPRMSEYVLITSPSCGTAAFMVIFSVDSSWNRAMAMLPSFNRRPFRWLSSSTVPFRPLFGCQKMKLYREAPHGPCLAVKR